LIVRQLFINWLRGNIRLPMPPRFPPGHDTPEKLELVHGRQHYPETAPAFSP
jgi:hypothetical protein